MILLLLLTAFQAQDEFPTWVRQLGSDSLVERQEAARRLVALGEPALERLGKARGAAGDPEVKARLEGVIESIRRAAALGKVFGPTRRVTVAARGQLLKEVLLKLATPGIRLDAGALDEESRVDFQVRDVPWWEAVDRFAKAVGARYELENEDRAPVRLVFTKGAAREFPVLYLEQFRISVAETQRFEIRSPEGLKIAAVAIVEVRHQPDLKPASTHDEGVRITAVKDALGKDARTEEIPGSTVYTMVLPLADSTYVWIRPDAAMPLMLEGTAKLRFAGSSREVSLDLAGDGSKARVGNFDLRVIRFDPSPTASILRIRAESKESRSPAEHLDRESLRLVDAQGVRHRGEIQSTRPESESSEWECEFTSGIEGPRRVTFRWIADFHEIEIPFRLDGVRLPDAK